MRILAYCTLMIGAVAIYQPGHTQTTTGNTPQVLDSTESTGSTGVLPRFMRAKFSWSMRERYGLDRNANGIIDLPNSRDYVFNQKHFQNNDSCACVGDDCNTGESRFSIAFSSVGTYFPPVGEPPDLSEITDAPEAGPIGGYTPVDPALLQGRLQRNRRTLTWTILGGGLIAPIKHSGVYDSYKPMVFTECLAEGEYSVSLTATDGNSTLPNGAALGRTVTETINVKDFLIVQIGDSYAAGEGVPEKRYFGKVSFVDDPAANEAIIYEFIDLLSKGYPVDEITRIMVDKLNNNTGNISILLNSFDDSDYEFVYWADDGKNYSHVQANINKKAYFNSTFPNGTPIYLSHPNVRKYGMPSERFGPLVTISSYIEPWETFRSARRCHDRSHRSSFNASSQAAIALERGDQKTSVTYVNVAQTGATTLNGVTDTFLFKRNVDKIWFDQNILPSRKIDNSCVGDLPFDQEDFMNSQLDQLKDIVGNRRIDALIITVGGNDAGFGSAAIAAMLRDKLACGRKVNFGKIKAAINSGDWNPIQNAASCVVNFGISLDDNGVGLDLLDQRFATIAFRLKDEFNVKETYITEYPDPTKGCGDMLTVLGDKLIDFEIDKDERQWLRENLFIPLNQIIVSAANAAGWNVISGYKSMPRGACGPRLVLPHEFNPRHPVDSRPTDTTMRRFRAAKEASQIQYGTIRENNGMLHPNEFGYAFMRDKLLEHLQSDLE